MDKTSLVVAFFVAAVLVGVLLRFHLLNAIPLPVATSKENFMQKPVGAPLDSEGMGPYDNIYAGSSTPAPVGGLLVGDSHEGNQLMLLSENRKSPECCPSQFTTDVGCVCLTESDKKMFASRGGNRT
jgi:hypothetical protein